MGINDGLTKLVEMPEVWNDTELSLDELNQITWEYVSEYGEQLRRWDIRTEPSPKWQTNTKVSWLDRSAR